MNFRRGQGREQPEINLIPMIDVLLVIIIFLMLTTTYARISGLEVNLPAADAKASLEPPNEINVVLSAAGQLQVGQTLLASGRVAVITEALRAAAQGRKDPVVVIDADAETTHQRVINVMQAAQHAGLPHVSFSTQAPR